MFELALAYKNGRGVATNEVVALDWISKAAAKNHVEAQYLYACWLEAGVGNPSSETKLADAAVFYEKAAEQNHVAAKLRISKPDMIAILGEPNQIGRLLLMYLCNA